MQKSYEQIEQLMEEIMRQQNERRKIELDALQSQINPHFLYNTLESITWMVEAQKNREAVIMISELAKLLRVSLSRGKTIIPIKDELQHSRSYMNIQLVRYKERFKIDFQIDEELYNYCIVKLVIQPILENAIYYGVGHMDEDDDGRIVVSGEKKDNDIYISIEDNGMGMRKEVLENILTDNNKVPKHGSGVGVINVHSRIKLMFGEGYGLTVYSEPDEGTKVVIHIPAIPYTKENAEKLEMQKYSQRGNAHEKDNILCYGIDSSCIGTVFCVEDFYSERAGKKSSRNTSGIRRPEMGFSDQRNEAVGKRESYTSGHLQHR